MKQSLVEKRFKHYVYTLAYPDDYPDCQKAGTIFYVGKGIGYRVHDHEQDARKGVKSHKCNVIRRIWANGGQVVKTIVAYFETHEEACMYEIALIFFMDGLTNLTHGGDGTMGYSVPKSEEHRRKIGEGNRGKVYSADTRRRISQAKLGTVAHNKGKPMSEEQRAKLTPFKKGNIPWNKGKPRSEKDRRAVSEGLKKSPLVAESRRKISQSLTGKTLPEKTKRKISEALTRNNPMRGKHHTEEALRKMRGPRKRVVAPDEPTGFVDIVMPADVISSDTQDEAQEVTLRSCPYCFGRHPSHLVEQCPLNPKNIS